MNIKYRDINNFECKELERLFLSVKWSSGHFPDKLVVAYDDEINFYENCGFQKSENSSPMFITTLWT